MHGQHSMSHTRRAFLRRLTLAGTGGLLALRSAPSAAEPPPETKEIGLQDTPAACLAPQYVAAELLKGEGFTNVQFVKTPDYSTGALNRAIAEGQIQVSLSDPPGHLMYLDGDAPIVLLAGIHAGCYELFGTDRVRTISDLKGKSVAVPAVPSGRQMFVAAMAASVGLDPTRDITWVVQPPGESMRLFAEGKIDAYLGFPPEPQELRAKKIGHVLVNTLTDRPWSQYFCCMVGASREFVRKSPVATKRTLRALLKAVDICALEPDRAARLMVDGGFVQNYDYTRQTIREIGYRQWRTYNPEETVRFYALRFHEVGFIKSSPRKLIAEGTDWRFLNELKKELKG
jgi:NitT/TauT family transport system substrate-binding protein